MDAAYDAERWSDFAVAVAGASAALAGLLVVAMSINVREILAGPNLADRAGSALVYLTSPLVSVVLVLVPGQSAEALGAELLVIGIGLALMLSRIGSPFRRPAGRTLGSWLFGSAIPFALIVGPTLLGGLGLVVGSLGGLYWLPVAVLVAIVAGLLQAWILLIEILR